VNSSDQGEDQKSSDDLNLNQAAGLSHAMAHPKRADVLKILSDVFKIAEFRGYQQQVIEAVLDRRDGLLVMPTGGGKSLCFQLPARIFSSDPENPGMTVVVSPLIALMKDQVDAARAIGLRASFINSSIDRQERESRERKLARGEFELLYVTPERFRKPEFQQAMAGRRVALLAIDEAHCVSQWGHDFRPDYSRLREWRASLGDPTCLALTATATVKTIEDISLSLGLRDPVIWNSGVRRESLSLRVLPVYGLDEKLRAILMHRHHSPGPAIVYVSLVQTLKKISEGLSRMSVEHLTYHGQMNDVERRRSQDLWMRDSGSLMLATPAFGLGINKPDVRLVMHAEMPGSIEAWSQETGRAGRDGKPAEAVVLFDEDDISIQQDFIRWSSPDPGFISATYQLIQRNLLRARQEGFDFLRGQMNFHNSRDFRVETAVNLLDRWGCLEGKDPRKWNCIESPSGEIADMSLWQKKVNSQNQKLSAVVEAMHLTNGSQVIKDLASAGAAAVAARDTATGEAESDKPCRVQEFERYFGIIPGAKCGLCDLCRPEVAV
jgi:ATP-dependent DNA helicase RecQ